MSAKSFLFFALATAGIAGCKSYPRPVPYTPDPSSLPTHVPEEQWVYREGSVIINQSARVHRPITTAEKAMVENGFDLANSMLVSGCFHNGVATAEMTHTNEETAEGVYATMTRIPPVRLDIDLYDGGDKHGTVGYDDSSDPYTIHMNLYFVNSAVAVASNMLHEAAHARGFIHKSSKEARSVPYTMNYLFKTCLKTDPAAPELPAGQLADGPD